MDAPSSLPAPYRIASLRDSLAFRLALLYGLAVVLVMLVVSVIFYVGTVGVLSRGIDEQLTTLSARLVELPDRQGEAALIAEIGRLLNDGLASDTEIYLLARSDGITLVGNIAPWAWTDTQSGRLSDQAVLRLGRPSTARVLPVKLPDGDVLVVGRDMPDQQDIRRLVARALATSFTIAMVMAIGGALLFHRRINHRLALIRDTTRRIESGQLDWRIPPSRADDEFSRLNLDINRMLDRIQNLMDGVRHISNAIAHDLRTPLARLRARIEQALRSGDAAALPQAAQDTITGIDQLILLFERLLQIAEAESGTRRQSFTAIAADDLVTTIAELYDASAEEKSVTLTVQCDDGATVHGDRALLLAMLVNLVENAFKYAAVDQSCIRLKVRGTEQQVEIIVEDNGPGIPLGDRARVLERFYRGDHSRSLPGNGLGLSLVAAIVDLHGGHLSLEDAEPGLRVRISLPRLPANLSNR